MGRKFAILAVVVAGALVLVAAFGVFAYRTVFAAAPAATSTSWLAFGGGGFGGGGFTDQALATALGVDVTKLQAAYKSATAEALKEAVAKGLITQTQADTLTARGFVLRGGQGEAFLKGNGIDYNSLLASALGVSVDKLTAAYQTAFNATIDQAVKDGRLTQAQADLAKGRYNLMNNSKFLSAMQSAFEAAVNQAVKDGVITQAQADQILSGNNGAGFGFGFGHKGMFGGMKGGMGGFGGLFGGMRRHGGFGKGSPANPVTPAPTQAPSGGL